MNIETFKTKHAEDAAQIALTAYMTERATVECLPLHDDYLGLFMQQLNDLAGGSDTVPGFAALDGGKLLGFIAGGYPVDNFFSSNSGVYIPLIGHGAAGPDRRLVYQRLYEAASGAWVREGRLTHAISMFAHDAEAVDAWFWLGFGLRCVDAIRPLADVISADRATALEVRKAVLDDAEVLYPLHAEHCGYYQKPPFFMPTVPIEGSLAEFRQWMAGENHHLWAAYADGVPVSYMRIIRGGETFVADDPLMYNCCGAYTTDAARGTGSGALLLSAIVKWMREQGCVRLGVDYESLNVYGSRFWMKHFTPFSFSAVRCIDNRIIEKGFF